jgi:secreted PhoX family phosphatase
MNRMRAAALAVIPTSPVFAADRLISTIARNGGGGRTGLGGPAANAQLNTPQGLCFDAAGNLFIADYGNNRVVRVDAVTGILTLVARTGAYSSAGDGGPAALASVNSPVGLAFDAAGNLYIAEVTGNPIRRVDASTGIITRVAGTG